MVWNKLKKVLLGQKLTGSDKKVNVYQAKLSIKASNTSGELLKTWNEKFYETLIEALSSVAVLNIPGVWSGFEWQWDPVAAARKEGQIEYGYIVGNSILLSPLIREMDLPDKLAIITATQQKAYIKNNHDFIAARAAKGIIATRLLGEEIVIYNELHIEFNRGFSEDIRLYSTSQFIRVPLQTDFHALFALHLSGGLTRHKRFVTYRPKAFMTKHVYNRYNTMAEDTKIISRLIVPEPAEMQVETFFALANVNASKYLWQVNLK